MLNFSDYLRFVCSDRRYCDPRSLYTATDALLCLEAQTAKQPKTSEIPHQQIEQFPVIVGLRKYALGEKREHTLLAGRPGSGKSTTLKQIFLELAAAALIDDTQPIPVLVQLKSDRPLLELIVAEFRRAKMRVTVEQIDDWLLEDKLVLLLDGINEIPSELLREKLQEFRDDNLTTPMIFTTRDLAIGGDLGIEKRLEMRPLTNPQMREFVQKYLPEYGETLLRQLNDRLRELAETPLLLKMLCDVFDPDTQQIPQSKGELFQRFDRDYQHIKKDIQAVPVSENFWEFKSEVLQHLAFTMIQADAQKPTEAWLTLPKDQAERILEKWLTERGLIDAPTKAKLWLKDLLNHHLLQTAADPKKIEFHHQLFQEYYAAEVLLVMLTNKHPDVMDGKRLQYFYLNYLKWTEAISIMLSLLEDETQALRVVKLSLDVDWILGARLAGAVKPRFQQQTVGILGTLDVPEWLKMQLLGETLSKNAAPELLKLLEGEDISIYRDIILSLIKIDRQLAASKMLPAISKIIACTKTEYFEEDFYLWALGTLKAVNKLGVQAKEHEISDLLKNLKSKPIYVETLWATLIDKFETVEEQWGKKSVPELIQFLRHEKKVVRETAAYHLSSRGSGEYFTILRELQLEIKTSWEYCSTISKIQVRCQFYNYEIAQQKLAPHTTERSTLSPDANVNTYIVEKLTLMSEQAPIFHQHNPTIGVNYAAGGSNPKVIQNVQNTQQSSSEAALNSVVQIIRALEQKYSFVQDEQQALQIIDAEFKDIQAKQLPQWQDLMNVKRLWNGGKKAAVKVGEHYAQENPWGKGLVAFLEGVSEDVK